MKKSSFLILIVLLVFACKKDTKDQVPFVPVDFYLYPSDPKFTSLNPVGGWAYISGGSRGIIIYRNSTDKFSAFDRHCTYEPSDPCGTVEVESSNLIAVDSCCGSKFLITDGSVTNGPAAMPLRQYNAVFDGSKLHIYN